MPASFTLEEVLSASGGALRSGRAERFAFVSTDTRTISSGALFVALKGENFDAHDFVEKAAQAGASGAIVRRGQAVKAPADFCLIDVEDTLFALSALAKFHRRRFKLPLGAVGGSNGKTTTKEMIGAILAARGPSLKTEGNLNNEIGVPLTLLRLDASHETAVIEMGMNHPGELERLSRIGEPDAAIITSVGAEHLEGLGSIEKVAEAEGEIFRGLRGGGLAIAPSEDALALNQAKKSGHEVVTFGRAADADVRLSRVVSHDHRGLHFEIVAEGQTHAVKLNFVGQHNAVNACGAFAMGRALGCTVEQCIRGLESAKPWHHRLELHQTGGFTILDDCYNANPASMAAALETLNELAGARRKVAVLGDMLELGAHEDDEHRNLGALAAKSGVALLVAFGPRSRHTFEAASSLGSARLHVADPKEHQKAVDFLKTQLREGDVVLVKGSRGMRLERVVEALTGQKGAGH